jgi:hypothetical protein
MLRRQTVAAIVRLPRRAVAIVRRRWEQRPSNAARSNLRQPKIVGDSVLSRRLPIVPPLHRAWDRPRSVEPTSPRRQRIAAVTDRPILLRGARWVAARTRTVGATVIIGIVRRQATVPRSSGATAVLRTRVVATGVAHLRAHSWICGSRLCALRRTAAVVIRGPATEVVADIVPRLPATAVRIAHPAAGAPRPMEAEVVDITAEVEAEDITAAEAAVRARAAEVVVVTRAEAATVAVIAKSS